MLEPDRTRTEFFSTKSCPYCAQMRERLEWDGIAYTEYDVETDAAARARLTELAGPHPMVPVLVEDGVVREVGIGGRGCYVTGG